MISDETRALVVVLRQTQCSSTTSFCSSHTAFSVKASPRRPRRKTPHEHRQYRDHHEDGYPQGNQLLLARQRTKSWSFFPGGHVEPRERVEAALVPASSPKNSAQTTSRSLASSVPSNMATSKTAQRTMRSTWSSTSTSATPTQPARRTTWKSTGYPSTSSPTPITTGQPQAGVARSQRSAVLARVDRLAGVVGHRPANLSGITGSCISPCASGMRLRRRPRSCRRAGGSHRSPERSGSSSGACCVRANR